VKGTRSWLVLGAGGLAALAAVVLSLTLGVGGESRQPSHAEFVRLWQGTRIGEPTQTVLARWPNHPYQHYTDGLRNDCYEWTDVPVPQLNNLPQNIYNLCFRDGVLRSKELM
jgi:hypothetical protein